MIYLSTNILVTLNIAEFIQNIDRINVVSYAYILLVTAVIIPMEKSPNFIFY